LADDKAPITTLFLAKQLEENDRIVVHPETTAELLTGKRVKIQSKGSVSELSVDAVVIGGRVSQFGLAEDLQRAGVRAMVYKIGDAALPQRVLGQPRGCGSVGENSARHGGAQNELGDLTKALAAEWTKSGVRASALANKAVRISKSPS
jgi:hypothetical protein